MRRRVKAIRVALTVLILRTAEASFADNETAAKDRYLVEYPATQNFCPPVETYFDDASQSAPESRARARFGISSTAATDCP